MAYLDDYMIWGAGDLNTCLQHKQIWLNFFKNCFCRKHVAKVHKSLQMHIFEFVKASLKSKTGNYETK